MKGRVTLVAAGAALGATLAVATLWGVREYRRHHTTLDGSARAELAASSFISEGNRVTGFGPAYNGVSCASCHNVPAPGGWGTATTLRVARRDRDGAYHNYDGGPMVQAFSLIDHECQAEIPADANVFSRRLPISTFGSGLVDAIPDDAIIAMQDPADRDGDGVRGRAARVMDRASGTVRVGRFGWKAQQASLLAFAADAYLHDMGVTNDLYPVDTVFGVPAERVRRCDTVADPEDVRTIETGLRAIDTFTAFMRSLPAPEPSSADSMTGAGLFDAIGCAVCHRPLVHGARAYSDFLLHDIGTGDGIREGDAGPGEMRTAALWGISKRRMYLHDGSAVSVADAIERHGGEATGAHDRFRALTPQEQQQLIAFVESR